LGAALNKLIGLKQYTPEDSYNFTKQYLQSELNFDLNSFLKMDNDLIVSYLTNKSFNTTHIETLSRILYELAETIEEETEQQNLYTKSKLLINWVSRTDKTYSVEREKIVKKIQQKIK
jgi:hypothetical protein